MNRVSVHIDGLIYAKQAYGGISRNFTNLVNALVTRTDVDLTLHLEQDVSHPGRMVATHEKYIPADPCLRPSRLLGRFGPLIGASRRRAYWSGLTPGVFHSTYYSSPVGLRIPEVLTMQDTIFEDFPSLFSLPKHHQHIADKMRAVERCAGLVFSSDYAKRRTEVHYELASRPTLVSPYAIDPCFRTEPTDEAVGGFRASVASGRPFLLHVGSRYLHKNVSQLLHAYAGWVRRNDIVLMLAGGGEMAHEERALVTSLGIGEQLVVVPMLDEAELLVAYHAAEALVYPSLSEGFGFPLLEAMACGLPVACSNAASLPEVGGNFPVYFDPTDVESIRAGLEEIVVRKSDKSHWKEAQSRARLRTWDDVAAEYVDFYRALSG